MQLYLTNQKKRGMKRAIVESIQSLKSLQKYSIIPEIISKKRLIGAMPYLYVSQSSDVTFPKDNNRTRHIRNLVR